MPALWGPNKMEKRSRFHSTQGNYLYPHKKEVSLGCAIWESKKKIFTIKWELMVGSSHLTSSHLPSERKILRKWKFFPL
jgi:hypothetical protein